LIKLAACAVDSLLKFENKIFIQLIYYFYAYWEELMDNLVSIIIPVFNVENYLPCRLDSVLAQDYANIEVILINDGSTDGSSMICDEYATKDFRVKVYHKKNGGVSSARNLGIRKSNGQFIAFVDSDDFVEQDFISFLYNNLTQYNADISSCCYYFYRDNVKTPSAGYNENYLFNNFEGIINCIDRGFFSEIYNRLYRREILENVEFDENIKISEDHLFNFNAYFNSNKSIHVGVPKYYYVWRQDSAMETRNRLNEDRLYMVEQMKKKIEKMQTANKLLQQHIFAREVIENIILLIQIAKSGDTRSYESKRIEIQDRLKNFNNQIIWNETLSWKFKIVLLINSINGRLLNRFLKYI
jgi:glycosyltransferase involved in cell wall biosynthesis